ncbi:disease resistance protein RPV1-like [Eucalyptus grandis]|uniref:disease resistance protein RPV1-like n=1 Tax=Eucalyptus grandis TaxID=71139 RepID=UPI00192E9A94|nr:disease resistance protein RPV1-like [Eucalyptus grandis]
MDASEKGGRTRGTDREDGAYWGTRTGRASVAQDTRSGTLALKREGEGWLKRPRGAGRLGVLWEKPEILANAAKMKRKMSYSPEIGSTSHGTLGALFDVFLSFRGPDTRTNFTDTLYYALLDKGIRVFIDKKGIDVGEEIGPEIFHAIDDSKICIPIFSKGYASKRGGACLETRVYRDALTQHKKECGVETVQGWEEALKEVTKIKGWDAKNKGYGELAHLIDRKVSVKLKVSSVYISDELVGTDESVNEIVDMLNIESKDVRIIGIWGMGGIGKTTLAKVVYSKLSTNFESHSFISDIREASKGFGLLNVQRQLISNIIGDVGVELSSIDHGMNMIKDQFCRTKVLIFLDDVDHASQLMALAAKKEWFDSLYDALLNKGIRVFLDKKGIDVGEEISLKIFQATDDSRICISIFSRGYASGSSCLRELGHMMECRKINELDVIPIFYDVDPFDVKLESEVYRDALTLDEEKWGSILCSIVPRCLRKLLQSRCWE